MSFHDDWKNAKAKFKSATLEKKPSAKVEGAFLSTKGTGVNGALKEMEAAKTVKDATAALAKFNTASDEYYKVLEKAINDPTSFAKKADAETYKTAAQALQKELMALRAEGKSLIADLDGKEKKAAVDLKAMAQQRKVDNEALAGAQAHLKLRQKMVAETTSWVRKASEDLTKIRQKDLALKTFQARAVAAEKLGLKSAVDQMEANATKALQDARTIYEDCQKEVKERTKEGGELLKAREDAKNFYDKLPEAHKGLKTTHNEAFAKFDSQQRTWQSTVQTMKTIVSEMDAVLDAIEAINGKIKPASEYLKWLEPEAKNCVTAVNTASTRVEKLQGLLQTQLPTWEKTPMTPELRKTVTGVNTIFQGTLEKMEQATTQIENLKKRLDLVTSQEVAVTGKIAEIRSEVQKFETFNASYKADWEKAKVKIQAQLSRKDAG